MDIHKPKPIRNWREFLKEYAIIVIGVLTALGAEQAVEWMHWRAQVTEAKELIATELAGNIRLAIYRMRTSNCTERRLDELGRILDTAAGTGSLPPVGDIATPPRGYWQNGAWESVVASQTATHFPNQQLRNINLIYKLLSRLEGYYIQELGAWNTLYAMVGPGRRLDPASEARLREALTNARAFNRLMTLIGNQLALRGNTLELPFSPEDLAVIKQGKSLPLLESQPAPYGGSTVPVGLICAPLGKPPSGYGQALYGAQAALTDDEVKALPDYGARPR